MSPTAGRLRLERVAELLSNDRANLVAIVVLAVLARAFLLANYAPLTTPDSQSYLTLAHMLASLNLSGSTGYRTPGYPLLLLLVGYSKNAAWVIQAGFGTVTSVLIYRLTRRVGGAPWLACLAALMFALNLTVLDDERQIMTEPLTVLLVVIAASLGIESLLRDRVSFRLRAALGLTLAVLCIVRPDMSLIAVFIVGFVLVHAMRRSGQGWRRGLRAAVAPALTMLVPSLVVLLAWASINAATFGQFTVSTVLGHNVIDHVASYATVEPGANHTITQIYVSTRDRAMAHGITTNFSWLAEGPLQRRLGLTAPEVSARLLSVGLGVTLAHPLGYLRSALGQLWPFWKLPDYWLQLTGAGGSVFHLLGRVERRWFEALALLFLALSLGAVVLRLSGRRARVPSWSAFLASIAFVGSFPGCFLAYGDPSRYGYPYFPLWLIVSLVAIPSLVAELQRLRIRVGIGGMLGSKRAG